MLVCEALFDPCVLKRVLEPKFNPEGRVLLKGSETTHLRPHPLLSPRLALGWVGYQNCVVGC